jgi:uncharacterized protein with PIN domain
MSGGTDSSSKKNCIYKFATSSKNDRIVMKRERSINELKTERPRRAVVSEKEALKRMKDFLKRTEQFLATARTGKSRSLRP